MNLPNVISAELAKLRTLPIAILCAVGTVLVGAAIATTLAATATEQGGSAPTAVGQAVPFAQVGIILLGVLASAHEHSGGQFRTSLAAVPNRGLLVTGKSIAALITVALTSLLTVGVSMGVVTLTHHPSDGLTAASAAEQWRLAGAVVYLTFIGVLSHAVGLLARHLVPALVSMLALVLIVPPLLGGLTEHARWLPDRAGSLLYLPGADSVLTPGTGTLVLLGWLIATGPAAVAAFITRDA